MEKCVILFSGGLDSRLVIKLMQKKNFEVTAVFFKLPFAKDNEEEVRRFCKEQKITLNIFDCTKDRLLKEYLEVVKNAKFGRGAGVNPCKDCKIFMLSKAREFADGKKINFIATGEVEGQRPMSQMRKSLNLIEEKSGLKGRILRPLGEQGISGRQRKKQIAMADKFNIDFPHPAGGCILCEKKLKNRFKFLLKRGLDKKEVQLMNIGRHFVIEGKWVVLGRDEKENNLIEKLFSRENLIIPDFPAPTAFNPERVDKEKINKLIIAYSKSGNQKDKEKSEKFKL